MAVKLTKSQLVKTMDLVETIPPTLDGLKANIDRVKSLAAEIDLSPRLTAAIVKDFLNPEIAKKVKLVAHSNNGNTYELREDFNLLGFEPSRDADGRFYLKVRLIDVNVNELPQFIYEIRTGVGV